MKRGVLIGFGKVAEFTHAPVWRARRDAVLVGVVEPRPDRKEAARRVLEVEAFDLLKDTPAADFAVVLTPPAFHVTNVLEALSLNLDVLCEKPLVTRPDDLRKIGATRKASKKKVYTVDNWNSAPPLRDLTERVAAGAVGTPIQLIWKAERTSHDVGARQDQKDWRFDPLLAGGGILFDHGWHALTYLQTIFSGEPKQLRTLHLDRGEVETSVILELDFDRASAVIDLTWNGTRRRNSVFVHGTRDSLWIQDESLSQSSIHPEWLDPVIDRFFEREDNFSTATRTLSWISQTYPTFEQPGHWSPITITDPWP